MATAYRYPGAFNAFVPKATGQVVDFTRDPKRYKLMSYCQLVKAPDPVGVYYQINPDDVTRLENVDEHVWHDGAKRPEWKHEGIRHQPLEFQCTRYDFGFTIGWQTIKSADYNILLGYTTKPRNQAMIHRTQRAMTLLEDSTKWPAGNTDTANNLNGGAGFWNEGTGSTNTDPHFLALKKTLDNVAEKIHLATNGVVGDFDEDDPDGQGGLQLLLSPHAAHLISQSAEIHAYLKESPDALAQIKGLTPNQNRKWGLPESLYGWKIIVENSVRVSERPAAAGTLAPTSPSPAPRRFIKNDTSAIVLSRPGKLDGNYGQPSFSTLQLYFFDKEMDVETFDNNKDRLTEGHVSINDKLVLAAPVSGFLIQNILAA